MIRVVNPGSGLAIPLQIILISEYGPQGCRGGRLLLWSTREHRRAWSSVHVGSIFLLQRRYDMNGGDLKCREVKTGYCRKRWVTWVQTGSHWLEIWKCHLGPSMRPCGPRKLHHDVLSNYSSPVSKRNEPTRKNWPFKCIISASCHKVKVVETFVTNI
jgi:hypothetical protein